jgi:hypothetical protein
VSVTFTITAAYPVDRSAATLASARGTVVNVLDAHQEAGTVHLGDGYHPHWGSEPVVVLTMVDPNHPYDVARDLAHAFNQDCVLVTSHVTVSQLVGAELLDRDDNPDHPLGPPLERPTWGDFPF